MNVFRTIRHWSLGIVALLLIGVLVQMVKQEMFPARADIIGVDVGACENVDPDPETGERLVYCCLDEIYQFYTEGLDDELDAFLGNLELAQTLSTASGISLFESSYQSTLHQKYGWQTFCGQQVACEICELGPQCGNKVPQEGEECDDGNLVDGDGCSSSCLIERVAVSSSSSSSVATVAVVSSSSDSSLSSVSSESSESSESSQSSSTSSSIESSSSAASSAQSSSVDPFAEIILTQESSSSSSEDTFMLPESSSAFSSSEQSSSQMSVSTEVVVVGYSSGKCGNGIIEEPEECDDRNANENDGCSRTCTIEEEYKVWKGNPEDTGIGDGIRGPNEQCDDGNTVSGDGCSATGRIESTIVTGSPLCGNGALDAGEECDDGNLIDLDTCSSSCFLLRGRIGNGIVEHLVGEQCDPASHNPTLPYGCDEYGQFILEHCGDGVLDPGEQCDQGEANSNNADAYCRPNCTYGRCGDSVLDTGEECDDGNLFNGDKCNRLCQIAGRPAAPTEPTTSTPVSPQPSVDLQQTENVPETGPALAIILSIGAAIGFAWSRRKAFA